ncbi:methyl-accepting chemotaxis protein [Candidatus Uabimicrobium amorphum]|uniref:Methyl-accepting chemotaxis protein n=1 Tax=Uabimicrobium amorphum TaxID=2596890 RepID=A0A5S9IJZ1_UABAM|nr:methyl-accepting chemotaxis protein [Candidatus Uabimicrobium amorphum]BBM82930.1 methyl-accepting chemotaxis protein [Candidatus Uabimicrobium amorphum]
MQNKKLSHPIILACLFVILSFTLYLSIAGIRSSIEKQSYKQLIAIRDLQAQRLEDTLTSMRKQVQNLAKTPFVVTAMQDFSQSFYDFDEVDTKAAKVKAQNFYQDTFTSLLKKKASTLPRQDIISQLINLPNSSLLLQQNYIISNPHAFGEKHKLLQAQDASPWSNAHKKYHDKFKNYSQRNQIADVLLIDLKKQNIVYSLAKQIDFATSLSTGPFQDSAVAYAYEDARSSLDPNFTKVTDLVTYVPAFGKATSFIASPIYKGDEKIGVLVAKVYYHSFNQVMADTKLWKRAGWGNTIETYVIGRDNKMRSNSRMFVEKPQEFVAMQTNAATRDTLPRMTATKTTVLLQNTDYYFAEETGCDTTTNYYGQEAIVAHANLNDPDLQWVVIAEQNYSEPFEQIRELENGILVCFALIFGGLLGFIYVNKHSKKQDASRLTQRLTSELSSIHQQVNQVGRRGGKVLKKCATNIELTTNFHHKVRSFNKDFVEDKEKAQHIRDFFVEIDQKLKENLHKMRNFGKNLHNVDDALKQIKNTILILENVAKETHIVSLNASIRAAREDNSPFSSVADEIRKLALKNADVLENASEKIDDAQKIVSRNNANFEHIEEKSKNIEKQIEKISKTQEKIVELKRRLLIYLDNLTNETQDTQFSCAYLQQDLERIAAESSNLTNQIELVAHNLKSIEL